MPDVFALAKQRKRWRWGFIASFIALPILTGAVVSMTAPQPDDSARQAVATTKGRDVAQQAVVDWLMQEPSPVPGGVLLSWKGSRPVTVPVSDNPSAVSDVQYSMEVDEFTVVSGEQYYTVGVQVVFNDSLGATVIGEPSLTPMPPAASSADWPNVTLWPSWVTTSATDSVNASVSAWAKAFTGTDPDALRLAVGDPSGEHFYMPLLGVASSEAKVLSVAQAVMTDDGSIGATVVARVELRVVWSVQANKTNDQTGDNRPVLTYDVLITQANTASPVVVAWGSPGSGPFLSAYQNALVGRDLTISPLDQSTADPQATSDGTQPPETQTPPKKTAKKK